MRRQDFHLAKVWKLGCCPWFEHPRVSKQEETQPFFVFGLVLVFYFCFGERREKRNIHLIRSRFLVVEDYSLWNSVDLLEMGDEKTTTALSSQDAQSLLKLDHFRDSRCFRKRTGNNHVRVTFVFLDIEGGCVEGGCVEERRACRNNMVIYDRFK